MKKQDAVRKWVNEFNTIPLDLIEKAYPNMEGIEVLATERECANCGCTDFTAEGSDEEDGEDILTCTSCGGNEFTQSYGLPMWGSMWTFDSNLDKEWAKRNTETMRECGIWVYESDELGIFFGVDGAGYDFYEAHWEPLYDARGLNWHTEE